MYRISCTILFILIHLGWEILGLGRSRGHNLPPQIKEQFFLLLHYADNSLTLSMLLQHTFSAVYGKNVVTFDRILTSPSRTMVWIPPSWLFSHLTTCSFFPVTASARQPLCLIKGSTSLACWNWSIRTNGDCRIRATRRRTTTRLQPLSALAVY